jgi:hypothetical protein
MAEKAEKQDTKQRKTKSKPAAEESVLVSAAKAIGATAGKIAAIARAKAPKIPKLQKKNKRRLPRKQKKALAKANAQKG